MLRGTVLDPSSAPVPARRGQSHQRGHRIHAIRFTNETGDYVIADLPYGTYEVRVVKAGFHELIRTGVVMNIGDRRTLDLNMAVGDVNQSLTVSGEAPLLREADVSLGQVIDNARLEQMPVIGPQFRPDALYGSGLASFAHGAILRQFDHDRGAGDRRVLQWHAHRDERVRTRRHPLEQP